MHATAEFYLLVGRIPMSRAMHTPPAPLCTSVECSDNPFHPARQIITDGMEGSRAIIRLALCDEACDKNFYIE